MPTKEQTAVYRCFAADGTLLYVGVADDVGKRWKEHAGDKPWWPLVVRQTVDWHDSRDEALRIERDAIRAERPVHNVVHAVDRDRRKPVPVPLTTEERARLSRYEDTPDDAKSEAELLDELQLVTRRLAHNRYAAVGIIRTLLPPGEEAPRGLFTRVVEVTAFKREYVARIRDGVAEQYTK